MTMSRIGCAPAAIWSQTPMPSSRRIGDDHRNIGAQALAQRQRQRQPRKRAAADDNASLCRHAVSLLTEVMDYTCYMTIAGRNRAAKQGY
jgi:hypothetical protein